MGCRLGGGNYFNSEYCVRPLAYDFFLSPGSQVSLVGWCIWGPCPSYNWQKEYLENLWPQTTKEKFKMTLNRLHQIVILCAALLNLVLGLYFRASSEVWIKRLQALGSLFLVFSPVLLLIAFFREPSQVRYSSAFWGSIAPSSGRF